MFTGEMEAQGDLTTVSVGTTSTTADPATRPRSTRIRLAEAAIGAQPMELFTSLNVGDVECRRWLVEVIRAPADYGQPENRQHHEELKRRHARVEARLPTLPDPPVSGEITREEWAARRADLQAPKSALRVQLEASDRDGHDVAERSANGCD